MSNRIEQEMRKLTNEQLKQCFNDIVKYRKTGIMGDTLIRKVRFQIANKIIKDNGWDSDCRVMIIPAILYEIAKRHYNKVSEIK